MPGIGLGELFGLGAALSWAGTGLLVRAHGVTFHAVTINAIRSTLAGIVFVAIWPFLADHRPVPLEALGYMFASLITGVVIGDTMYFEALKRIGVSRAMPISMGYPVLTFALAALLLHEPFGPRAVAGMLLTLGGVYLVAVPGRGGGPAAVGSPGARSDGYWRGVALASAAAITWSASTLLLRPALDLVDVPTASAIRLPVVAVVLWVASARLGGLPRLSHFRGRALLAVAAMGFTSIGATVFFLQSIALAGAGRAAVLTATSPLFAVPLSMLILGEKGTWWLGAGTLCSVLGVVLLAER